MHTFGNSSRDLNDSARSHYGNLVSSEIIVDLVISSNTYVSNCMIVSSCRSWALLMVSMLYLESTYLTVFS